MNSRQRRTLKRSLIPTFKKSKYPIFFDGTTSYIKTGWNPSLELYPDRQISIESISPVLNEKQEEKVNESIKKYHASLNKLHTRKGKQPRK